MSGMALSGLAVFRGLMSITLCSVQGTMGPLVAYEDCCIWVDFLNPLSPIHLS